MNTRLEPSATGDTPFERLLGHNPHVLNAWNNLGETLLTQTSLPAALLEEVRRVLAYGNKCLYCMAKGAPAAESPDQRTSLAAAFAELFVQDHLAIMDEHFDVLREEFTETEIAELCAFISFFTASQRFGAIMNLQPETVHENTNYPE